MSKPKIIAQQQGMVAIITTMILMIVISLIVLGFSQLVRRNQRQALDAQLSSQAFYAAESGLNLGRQKLNQPGGYRSTDCIDDEANPEYKIDSEDIVVSCLMVSPALDIKLDGLSGGSRVVIIDNDEAGGIDAPVGSASISWSMPAPTAYGTSSTCAAAPPVLPNDDSWGCKNAMVRIDLVPISNSMDRATLIANQSTMFLYPVEGSGGSLATTLTPADKGKIVGVSCVNGTAPGPCRVVINNMAANKYAVRIMSLYRATDVVIQSVAGGGLISGQAIIDSTGRAQDVLKRVQARVPSGTGESVRDFAIDSYGPLCKTYKITPATNNVDSGSCTP